MKNNYISNLSSSSNILPFIKFELKINSNKSDRYKILTNKENIQPPFFNNEIFTNVE